MKLKIFILIIFIFNLSSCANFLTRFENYTPSEKRVIEEKKSIEAKNNSLLNINNKNYCTINNQSDDLLILGNSKQLVDYTKNLFSQKYAHYTLVEKSILYSLMQLNLRPDLSTAQSRFQLILKVANDYEYFDFYSSDPKGMPFFYALEKILNKYKSNKDLLYLIKKADQMPNKIFKVDEELEKFLKENYSLIKNNPKLASFYIRGDETLKKDERIPRVNIEKLYFSYKKNIKKVEYQESSYLFTYNKNDNLKTKCNYDLSLYDNSIFLINDKIINSNLFGIQNEKQLFIGINNLEIENDKNFEDSLMFQGKSHTKVTPLCIVKQDENELALISTNDRDPGQHLHHLLNYGFKNFSAKRISKILDYSRHLFLADPLRLTIESEKSSKNQLSELLTLNFPIYHAEKLGKIWASLKNKSGPYFFIDSRSTGSISCEASSANQ